MSFYSALELAANRIEGVVPCQDRFLELCREIGVVNANWNSEFSNLAEDVGALFDDPEARAANTDFFCPDTISFSTRIQVLSVDDAYEGQAYCISIHGNGYFFPWTQTDLRNRVLSHPKLKSLRDAVQRTWGGGFHLPFRGRKFLRERRLSDDDGWAWFMSESM